MHRISMLIEKLYIHFVMFGNWEQYPGYWQMSFLNTDGTLYFGGAV